MSATGASGAAGAVRLRGVGKRYGAGDTTVRALDDVDLDIGRGEVVVVLGPSGSGKTTLLNVIGGLDLADAGEVAVDGVGLHGLRADELTRFRRDHVAFVFRFFNLVSTLTAHENVELIAELRGRDAGERADAALRSVGLAEHGDRFPSALSGGQQQRVAVARALAKDTPVLLCDEPTGALDRATGRTIVDLLRSAADDHGRTVVVVTHDTSISEIADRTVTMVDGRISDAP
jgi:putative ABC transport system ATP-binding protein